MRLDLFRIAISTVLITTSISCATVFSSGPQTMTLNSDPPGATYQYGPYQGKTPATLEASRGDLAHVATFSKPGYETQTLPVETGVQGVTWVDVLFWPGFIVDFVTGNAYKVTTPTLNAELTPSTPPVASATASAPAAAVAPTSAHASDLPK